MRKTCVQSVNSLGIFSGVLGTSPDFTVFLPILSVGSYTTSSQNSTFSTQPEYCIFPGVQKLVSTVSTIIITITTFYLKDSLTIHRGIK